MADTRVQLEVEDWVRETWMQQQFAEPFSRNRVKLSSGGVFDFDAVSADRSIVACISTSSGKTSSGKAGVGKLMKIRSDMLFLVMAEGIRRRLVVLTERDMYDVCTKEQRGGRVPPGIEFVLADIPDELRARLVIARKVASKEVEPSKVAEELPDEILLKPE